jgi:signal transduction histidine kinase
MPSLKTAPLLAEAASLLSGQLQAQLERLAGLLVRAGELERRFQARLRRLGFDTQQRKALAAITPGAAARILARHKPLSAFIEQTEYSGRRLAKLNLPPGAVLEALQEYDRLLGALLRRRAGRECANFQWAREQLSFCVVLTLNNAFYQVREAEAQTFYELAQAELESKSQSELLRRSAEILARFAKAQAGRVFWLDGSSPPALVRRLSKAWHIERGKPSERLLLEAEWRGRYACCWSIPFHSGSRLAGVMQFGFSKAYQWLPRELQLLRAAAERCWLACEKARLMEDLAAREEQVRKLAAHMLQVEEAERRRISRELHDEAGQLLLYLRLQLEMLERFVPEALPELRSGLAGARELIQQTIVEIRRLLADLSPAVLEQLGLAAALRQLVSRNRRLHAIQIRLQVARLGRLPKRTETVLYRLVQECCNNIARHSAASDVNISIRTADGEVKLRVEDNGVGFKIEEALAKRGSFGLAGMRERVALLGGDCEIRSGPGQGTSIWIRLPIPSQEVPEPEAASPASVVPQRL